MKPIWGVTKRNFASSLVAFIITIVVVVLATTSPDSTFAISRGNYTWIYLAMLPFFVVFGNFKKLLNLNANKKSYYLGAILTYAISALIISSVNTLIHLTIDNLNTTQTVINLMELCGWWNNGIMVAFIQQFIFLFMSAIFLHVLLSMQPYWYGWLVDGIIIAILCIFIPIAPLRKLLVSFFQLIMFNSTAWLHIIVCILACLIFYLIGLAVIKRKSI